MKLRAALSSKERYEGEGDGGEVAEGSTYKSTRHDKASPRLKPCTVPHDAVFTTGFRRSIMRASSPYAPYPEGQSRRLNEAPDGILNLPLALPASTSSSFVSLLHTMYIGSILQLRRQNFTHQLREETED